MKTILTFCSALLVCTACQHSHDLSYHEQITIAHQQVLAAYNNTAQHFEWFESNQVDLPDLKHEVLDFNAKADSIRNQIKAIPGRELILIKSAALKYINGLKSIINREYKNVAGIVSMSDVPMNRAENETIGMVIAKNTAALEESYQQQLKVFIKHK